MKLMLENEIDKFLCEEYKAAINAASIIAEINGTKIFLIGGIVRDLIMQRPIKDIDITVQGDAVNFAKMLETSGFTIISVQESLRTAKLKYENGVEIDFASTREEFYPISGNLPVVTNFGCELEKDVKRRDFTINTLAISLTGEDKYSLIDYYDGYYDILNKQIKILHKNSFIDDPSRIIRALKFMLRFSFEIEEETKNLMTEYLNKVNSTMPLERVKNELKQYFSQDNNNTYDKIIETGAYKLVSDNCMLIFNNDYFEEIKRYDLLDKTNYWFLFLLLLIFKSDYAIERLNLTANEKKSVTDLKNMYFSKINNNNYDIYNFFRGKSYPAIAAYYVITGSHYVKKYLDELSGIRVQISGMDLLAIGLKPSPKFNEIFDRVLREKLNGNLPTKKDEIDFVMSIL